MSEDGQERNQRAESEGLWDRCQYGRRPHRAQWKANWKSVQAPSRARHNLYPKLAPTSPKPSGRACMSGSRLGSARDLDYTVLVLGKQIEPPFLVVTDMTLLL